MTNDIVPPSIRSHQATASDVGAATTKPPGLPGLAGTDHVGFTVPDLDEAVRFFVDVIGHPESRPLQLAMEELGFFASEVVPLGTYPAHPFRGL